MGKSYAKELALLNQTYRQSSGKETDRLVKVIASVSTVPVLAVGSGGSQTTAHFASFLHEHFSGNLAKAITPLELTPRDPVASHCGIMFFSASGKNQDIVSAFERAKDAEPHRLLVLCGRVQSPLYRLGAETPEADSIAYRIPGGRDGFLATNSVVASCALLARAYFRAFKSSDALPDSIDDLAAIGGGGSHDDWREHIDQEAERLWKRDHLIVLYGRSTRSAAADVESRFHEAALGPVQIADFRNFAHGRHHWLAKHKARSSVLALVTSEEAEIAHRTLSLIPSGVPVTILRTEYSGPRAALASVMWSIQLAGSVGKRRGIDPGRPGVPEFGRKIYNLRTKVKASIALSTSEFAVQRKLKRGTATSWDTKTREQWRASLAAFQQRLTSASFGALALDYDGTLCGSLDRGKKLQPEVASELERVLAAGLPIGIATGRGQSVRRELRASLNRKYWSSVIVGYYNGSDIGSLEKDARPDRSQECEPQLAAVVAALELDERFKDDFQITTRRHQITVEPRSQPTHEIWPEVHDLVLRVAPEKVTVLRSAHSVDIVSDLASKRRVLDKLATMYESGLSILCIGDRGRWPGNDFELLLTEHSLSVDEVSTDPASCWNLAPAGVRGLAATLYYLRALKIRRKHGRLEL